MEDQSKIKERPAGTQLNALRVYFFALFPEFLIPHSLRKLEGQLMAPYSSMLV